MKNNKKCLTKKERKEIEFSTIIKSIRIHCGKLKKSVVIPWKECSINAGESPCDLCGSHGYKEIEVKCVCGMVHTICGDSW